MATPRPQYPLILYRVSSAAVQTQRVAFSIWSFENLDCRATQTLCSNNKRTRQRTGRPTILKQFVGLYCACAIACKKGCRGPNCWQGRRLPRHTVLFDSMAPWRYSLHRDALHCIHCPVREPSQRSMHGARCPAEPLDVQENSFSKSAANSSQIRRRCSGVEDDYGRDVCKFVCPP